MATYQNMQNQQNLMEQTRENGRKPHFEPDFRGFGPISGPRIFFSKIGFVTFLPLPACNFMQKI